jgi:hypothetical protein
MLRPTDDGDFPAWGERMLAQRSRTRRLTEGARLASQQLWP